jgi:signal transduction histidine kinase
VAAQFTPVADVNLAEMLRQAMANKEDELKRLRRELKRCG